MLSTNRTKSKLKTGECVFGCFIRYPEPALVEFISSLGWDFVVFDGEHGPIDARDCENLIRAAELADVTPISRVPGALSWLLLRALDCGAQGIHIPMVNSAAEAEAIVKSAKYGPRGNRGLAGVRAAGYGQKGSLAEYVRRANAETMIVAHVETESALEQVAEIARVDGIDVVFIGPTDLSHSLGFPGQIDHPKVQAAMDRIIDGVRDTEAAVGIMVGNAKAALEWRERGARYVTVGLESILAPGTRDYLQTVRQQETK